MFRQEQYIGRKKDVPHPLVPQGHHIIEKHLSYYVPDGWVVKNVAIEKNITVLFCRLVKPDFPLISLQDNLGRKKINAQNQPH